MDAFRELLQQQGLLLHGNILAELKRAGKLVSGKSASAITVKIDDEGIKIIDLKGVFYYALYGRRPSFKMYVSRSFIDNILGWINAKKINLNNKDERSIAYAIAMHISKYGTRNYGKGQGDTILKNALDSYFLSNFENKLLEFYINQNYN